MKDMEPLIDRLKEIDWFVNIDQAWSCRSEMQIESVSSWKRAIALRGKNKTSNAFLEGANILTCDLGLHFLNDYRKWNQNAAECRSILEEDVYPVVDSTIDSIPELHAIEGGSNTLKDSVRWDLSHIVMEHVYSDLVPPRFYALLFEIYQAGHFPCGWDEVWPDGKLWIY